jgi:hypothetical protein
VEKCGNSLGEIDASLFRLLRLATVIGTMLVVFSLYIDGENPDDPTKAPKTPDKRRRFTRPSHDSSVEISGICGTIFDRTHPPHLVGRISGHPYPAVIGASPRETNGHNSDAKR